MTPEILKFLQESEHLIGRDCTVFEVGSYNVNGSARASISHKSWLGVDLSAGPDVDVVVEEQCSYMKFLEERNYLADTFVCCECLEHTRDPIATVNTIKLAMAWSIGQRRSAQVPGHPVESKLIITAPSYHFQYHAYPRDYWRFSADTMEDVFFDGVIPLHIDYLDSNEGPNTTVVGIAKMVMPS